MPISTTKHTNGGRLNDKDMLGYFVYHTSAIDWLADHGIKLDDITITVECLASVLTVQQIAPIGGFLSKEFILEVVQKENIPVFNKVRVNSFYKMMKEGNRGVEANADGPISKRFM